MTASTLAPTSPKHPQLIAEGKTKQILATLSDPKQVLIVSKDDLTAGDGAKHDVIAGKAALATTTTCSVFRLLKECGLPVAFHEQVDEVTFRADRCQMLPYEVVIRREAHGSYLKRRPDLQQGHLFPKLVLEFFLKTSGKRWKQHELLCDDPLMLYRPGSGTMDLYTPKSPLHVQGGPFLTLREDEVFTDVDEWKLFDKMGEIACRTFLILEKAWQLAGRRLVDFKVEFGLTPNSKLLLADVIDNDSWRVVENGQYIDKQVYRDGGSLSEVETRYRRVVDIVSRFHLPRQQVIIWRGSDKDDITKLTESLEKLSGKHVSVGSSHPQHSTLLTQHTCSVHKEPVQAIDLLNRSVQSVPDSVIIAYIGRSNGAGPTLAAGTTVPVITVPAGYEDFPNDIWSSLRAPSNVPVMIVPEPGNAALAALQILAARNPLLYMHLREKIEERAVNTVHI